MKPFNQSSAGQELIETSQKKLAENIEKAIKLIIEVRGLVAESARLTFIAVSGLQTEVINDREDGEKHAKLIELEKILYDAFCDLAKLTQASAEDIEILSIETKEHFISSFREGEQASCKKIIANFLQQHGLEKMSETPFNVIEKFISNFSKTEITRLKLPLTSPTKIDGDNLVNTYDFLPITTIFFEVAEQLKG